MTSNEFDLIKRYFQSHSTRPDVIIESGDDCAIVEIAHNQQLAVSMDTFIEGVHFLPETPANDIGYKALAINLSDLAACGATPCWVTLALTLPHINEVWLHDFCEGFFQLCELYQVALIGGDLTKGALSMTAQAHGTVPKQQFITRKGAKPGDLIFVTGYPGHAALGLMIAKQQLSLDNIIARPFIKALNRPKPRIAAGIALRELASSAIDVSDGLLQDLNHILNASQVGAIIQTTALPIQDIQNVGVKKQQALILALNGGDDYELCFTAPQKHRAIIESILDKQGLNVTCIGEITSNLGCICVDDTQQPVNLPSSGFQHFH